MNNANYVFNVIVKENGKEEQMKAQKIVMHALKQCVNKEGKKVQQSAQERETHLRHDNDRRSDAAFTINKTATKQHHGIKKHRRIKKLFKVTEEEHLLLKNFCKKMNDIKYKVCPVCNEKIPGMTIIKDTTCRRCHMEKKSPKKFSKENNMDMLY